MSPNRTRFQSREHAGSELARALRAYRGTGALVLAIPRGGVRVGRVVATALEADFDLAMARRIGAGVALDETGIAWHAGNGEPCADEVPGRGTHFDQLRRQAAVYAPFRARCDPRGRVVIVVDDGLVSGATMYAALRRLRKRGPARIVCALPVAARHGLEQVRALADEVVCLDTPERISDLAHHYREFQLDSDDRIRQLLAAPAGAGMPPLSLAAQVPYGSGWLPAMLESGAEPQGVVLMAYAGGAQRRAARSHYLARKLRARGFATMLVDLRPDSRFDDAPSSDLDGLAARLRQALDFLRARTPFARLPAGLLSTGTAAAAAVRAVAADPGQLRGMVFVAGRADLAGRAALAQLSLPVLLLCASGDPPSIEVNDIAFGQMHGPRQLRLIATCGRAFEDSPALASIASLTADWFALRFSAQAPGMLAYRK
ncbi:phosphoribosyltransferase [Cupriavidus necator]|uniref:phosphoribosyltransferase family protein n=1 Tax=Cupriavidus necator TaxID=106590 RepID=UPI0014905B6E|nr:phosphoribosyltransferase family protein [Cupriavidus necator]NOV22530.1 phosphoribosyltransferase [Cupriavidus necator]